MRIFCVADKDLVEMSQVFFMVATCSEQNILISENMSVIYIHMYMHRYVGLTRIHGKELYTERLYIYNTD